MTPRSFTDTLGQLARIRGIMQLLTLLPPVAVIGLYGYIGIYNRLQGDSFCSFYYAERLGLLRSIWNWRLTWSGRYAAYAFDWLAAKAFGVEFIPLIIPIALALWVSTSIIAIHLLLRSVPSEGNRNDLAFILGPIFIFVVLVAAPEIRQSFLWLDGFRAYTLPLILLGLYLILHRIFIGRIETRRSQSVASILAFCLFLASGGLSETFAAFQFALLIFWLVYFWITERPANADHNLLLLIAGLLGAVTALLVVVSASGNQVRQSLVAPPPGIVDLISISLAGYADLLGGIMLSPTKMTAILGAITISAWAGSIHSGRITEHRRKIPMHLLGAFILSFSCIPPGVYGYNEPPPGRVLIIAVFIMSALLMSSSFLLGNLVGQGAKSTPRYQAVLLLAALLLISFSGWKSAAGLYASRSTYIDFAQKWDVVDALIVQAKNEGKESIKIPHIGNWAQVEEPNENPKFWANQCYSSFYGIQVFGPSQ
jgi:hypothetical protein